MPATELPKLKRAQIALLLRANERSIFRWENEGLPVAEPGHGGHASLYDPAAVVAWYVQRRLNEAAPAEGMFDKDTEQAKQAAANTERIKLDIARRRGELFDAKVATQAWLAMVAAFRARALAIPRAVAEGVIASARQGPGAVEALLTDAVRDALTALADWTPEPDAAPSADESPC